MYIDINFPVYSLRPSTAREQIAATTEAIINCGWMGNVSKAVEHKED